MTEELTKKRRVLDALRRDLADTLARELSSSSPTLSEELWALSIAERGASKEFEKLFNEMHGGSNASRG